METGLFLVLVHVLVEIGVTELEQEGEDEERQLEQQGQETALGGPVGVEAERVGLAHQMIAHGYISNIRGTENEILRAK